MVGRNFVSSGRGSCSCSWLKCASLCHSEVEVIVEIAHLCALIVEIMQRPTEREGCPKTFRHTVCVCAKWTLVGFMSCHGKNIFRQMKERSEKGEEACELIERCSSKRKMRKKYCITKGRKWRIYKKICIEFTSFSVFILYVTWLTWN